MASRTGLLSTVSKVVPFVSGDKVTDETGDREQLLGDSDSAGYFGEDKATGKKLKTSTNSGRSIRKSNSNTDLCELTRAEDFVADLLPSLPPIDPPSSSGTSLRPPPVKGHRLSSDSRIETRSPSKRQASLEMTVQRDIMDGLSNIKHTDTLKRNMRRCGSGASSPAARDEVSRIPIEWRSSIRSSSDPDLRAVSERSSRSDLRKPLKTCLKHKAKSANKTPDEPTIASRSSVENQKLRRVKTVDFEKNTSDYVRPQGTAPSSAVEYRRARHRKASKRGNSCPGRAMLARRSPACPAVTRTDVHVIAIAPSSSKSAFSNINERVEVEEADPATPTMQLVESGNGSYEVIWDDVPPEHSVRTQRRKSSASQTLEAASAGTEGLECVNTKLTEWSGTWNTSSDYFKPTVVVFPDDDGSRRHFECAIVDDEDIEIFAPPNSERVSAVHSRRPSRPTSARMSRAASQDDFGEPTLPRDILLDDPALHTEGTLVVPDPEA